MTDNTTVLLEILENGESPVWTGRPDPERSARAARVLVGIGLLFLTTSIAFFAILQAILSPWLALAGLPFAALGFWLIAAPNLARRRAVRTLYVLTNRRALIRRPRWSGGFVVEEFLPEQIDEVTHVEDPDGTGHLVFFVRETIQGAGMVTARKGFQAIDSPRDVGTLVRRTLLDQPPAAAPGGTALGPRPSTVID